MDYLEKQRLTFFGKADDLAAGTRLKATRRAFGISQEALGKAVGVGKSAVANMEAGRSFPSKDVMVLLFNEHRVDANFFVLGHYQQLPGDVQDRLIEELRLLDQKAKEARQSD